MFLRWPRYVQVVWMAPFARTVAGVLDEEDIRQMESRLAEFPRSGVVLSGTGGARKVRIATHGRGKSGSVRVVYYFDEACEQIYLLFAFSKNVQASLTADQARRVRALVEMLKAQDCHGNER